MDEAFADEGGFDDHDWEHTIGGEHVCEWSPDGSVLLAHAAVVPRTIWIDDVPFSTGHVEGVAALPSCQGTGLGTVVMERAGDIIRSRYDLGVLGAGAWHFYERLGWERWAGTAWCRRPDGSLERTPDDEDGLMVLRFGPFSGVSLAGRIVCEWRAGDVW